MAEKQVRIGIVGAGDNTRTRHIPGFQTVPGVEVISVVNRSRESSEKVAHQFEIPKVYDNWLDLVRSEEIDTVCIGTWPHMHCPVTLEALEADKHVLTEARMAMNAHEAHAMLVASRRKPHLVTQIVPSPLTLTVDRSMQRLVAEGYLGEVLAVELRCTTSAFLDRDSALHWRHNVDLSGVNTLMIGIYYEALIRWVGPASRVMASTRTFVRQRRDEQGLPRSVTVPDHVDIVCDLASGGVAHLRFSAVTGLVPGDEAWVFGSEGTLQLDLSTLRLSGGRRGDKSLQRIPIPKEEQIGWRVEEEFINAIRGKEKVKLTSFEDGVKYMEFTEAVIRSARTGQAIHLPLSY